MQTVTGQWIKDVRMRLHLTQQQFAARLGVSQGAVANWENDKRQPLGPALILLRYLALEADRVGEEQISA